MLHEGFRDELHGLALFAGASRTPPYMDRSRERMTGTLCGCLVGRSSLPIKVVAVCFDHFPGDIVAV